MLLWSDGHGRHVGCVIRGICLLVMSRMALSITFEGVHSRVISLFEAGLVSGFLSLKLVLLSHVSKL